VSVPFTTTVNEAEEGKHKLATHFGLKCYLQNKKVMFENEAHNRV
jgi:hypothetical protein